MKLPGPRLPAAIQTALLVRDPVGYLERCERRYGPLFRMKLIGFPRYVYVTDPQMAREVYSADRTVGRAGPVRQAFLEPMLGEHSLLCLEGDEWLRQRKLLGPAFHRRHVEGFEGGIAAIAARAIEGWPLEESLALRPRFQEITLEVILRIVFGLTDRERLAELRRLLPEFTQVGGSLVLWTVPGRAWRRLDRSRVARRVPNPLRRFLRLRDEVDELLHSEIAARRTVAADPDRRDVLSMLIRARDDEGRAMSDAELRDELVTLLEAGHETTATALAWTFERLMRSPAALRRLLAELDAGGEAYLEAVVKEALRSRTVVLDTPRLLEGPVTVGGHEIPAGWYVAPALPLVQRARTAWSEPEEFRPERFLEGDGAREGWIPFGGGKRHCVGSHLALLEMKVIVREVLRRVELEPVDAEDERARMQHVTLVPSELARARLRRRSEEAAC
jgi:cytochrome P450 family 135